MSLESHLAASWANQLSEKIVLEAIRTLQEMEPAFSGADSGLENLWEEICVQVQIEESVYWDTYVSSIEGLLGGLVAELNRNELLAIWIQTDEYWDFNDDLEDQPTTIPEKVFIDEDVIVKNFMNQLLSAASNHTSPNITRYSHARLESDEDFQS